jgi:hypothetical protein
MNCIVELDGREAIPVRAIPYITGWGLSPDVVASSFAQKDTGFERLGDLRAFHVSPDGSIGDMLPRDWDNIEDELEAFHLKLEAKNPDHRITRPEWFRRSIPLLPPCCFVWRDEFEEKYQSSLQGRFFVSGGKAARLDEAEDLRPGEREFNYNPRIPPEMIEAVFEGFPGQSRKIPEEAAPVTQAPEQKSRLQERRILEIIREMGHDPKSLPKSKQGKGGVKADVWSSAQKEPRFFTSRKTFDLAWQRLRGTNEISDADDQG